MNAAACRVKKLLRVQWCRCGQRNTKTAARRDGTFLPGRQRRQQGDRAPRGSRNAERAPVWAHTHHRRQGPSPVWGHGSCCPVGPAGPGGAHWQPGCHLAHLSTASFAAGTELHVSPGTAQGGGLWWVAPKHSKRDGASTTASRAPPTAPPHCGLPNRGFSFFGWNTTWKFQSSLGIAIVFYVAGLMIAVCINPLDHFEYHQKDLE